MTEALYWYLALVNILTFVYFTIDKRRAKNHGWRIPEKRLLTLVLIGGSLGGIFGMELLKHKTRNEKFKTFIPMLFLVHVIGLCFLLKLI